MKKRIKTGIIGCGNMGQAILKANTHLLAFDTDKNKLKRVAKAYRITTASTIHELILKSSVIVIAVKPQNIDSVLQSLEGVSRQKLIISIAAGISTRYIQKKLGKGVRAIRIMPNIAAQVRCSISAIVKGRWARTSDVKTATKLFSALGATVQMREEYIDAFTALAGSGPAYFYYFIEALTKAAQKLGFSKQKAQQFAVVTAAGSMVLLAHSDLSPGELRKKVTSKGGTTEAAIKVFQAKQLNLIVRSALFAAARRAKELSRG